MSNIGLVSSSFCADVLVLTAHTNPYTCSYRWALQLAPDIIALTYGTGFTLHITDPPRREPPDQLRQLPKIPRTELASARGHHHKRIELHKIRPTRRHRYQMAFLEVKEHPVLAPVVAIHFEIELAPGQRMEWMGYPETLSRNVTLRCSRRPSPRAVSNAVFRLPRTAW